MMRRSAVVVLSYLALAMLACTVGFTPPTPNPGGAPVNGETARVVQIVDGDTIEVEMNGIGYRVRYVGVNTPERDEVCYREATDANAALVENQTVTMVRDESNTDRYGRLLRYIYVGDTFVNEQLVRGGWAEAVEYDPDRRHTGFFRELEAEAAAAGRGCHPTGIFNDGSTVR